jgi:hypothetical protein
MPAITYKTEPMRDQDDGSSLGGTEGRLLGERKPGTRGGGLHPGGLDVDNLYKQMGWDPHEFDAPSLQLVEAAT